MPESFARRFASLLRVLDAGRASSTSELSDDRGPSGPSGSPTRQTGDTVGRYRIESFLGRGGMGEVYAAHDERLGRRVALKLVEGDRDGTARMRALREARAAAAFEHPNAVVVFDVGETGSTTLLAMELVGGRTLRSWIGEDVTLERRIRWLVDIARALGAAHRVGLVHRDVKPDNVMVRDDGVVKVLDFGIARRLESAALGPDLGGPVTAEGVVVGTPLYLSPEQLRNEEFDGRADQFAWGVTAYELIAGRVPWKGGDNLALVAQILSARVAPLVDAAPSLHEEVDRIVRRALSNDPSERFATMDELADALEPFAEQGTLSDPSERAHVRPEVVRHGDPAAPESSSGAPVHALESPLRAEPSLEQRTSARAALTRPRTTHATPKRRWVVPSAIVLLGGVVAVSAIVGTRRSVEPTRGAASPAAIGGTVRCSAATIASSQSDAELARAIGIGTCMRLATELGVDWSESGPGEALSVSAKVESDAAIVALSMAGREAGARNPTLVEAMDAAVRELARQLSAPAPNADAIHALGATDAESARRIARVWRRIDYRLATDPEAELERLAESDPDSPWPHVLLVNHATEGSDRLRRATERALASADRLPPARAEAVRGYLALTAQPEARIAEGLAMLRRAFVSAPDDADVGVILAVALGRAGPRDEAFAMLTRLMQRFPARSLPAVRQGLFYLEGRITHEEKDRLHEHLRAVLPEAQGWPQCVSDLVTSGHLEEADRALILAHSLGRDRIDPRLRFARADVALAAFRPEEARRIGAEAFAEPHPKWSLYGAAYVIAAYRMEGRLAEAQSAELAEIERQRGADNPLMAVAHALREARIRRWLDQPRSTEQDFAWLERVNTDMKDVDFPIQTAVGAEIALARMHRDAQHAKVLGASALEELEARIDAKSGGDRTKRDAALLATLPLVRAVRGHGAAAKRWLDAEHASDVQRRLFALDAALALEAVRDRVEARRAYEFARNPALFPWDAFSVIAAELRLAELDRADGLTEAAVAREAWATQAWSASDKGVREAILAMR